MAEMFLEMSEHSKGSRFLIACRKEAGFHTPNEVEAASRQPRLQIRVAIFTDVSLISPGLVDQTGVCNSGRPGAFELSNIVGVTKRLHDD